MKNKIILILLWITMSIIGYKNIHAQDDSPPEETAFGSKDVSGMFNERGYQKSSSVNFDEQEIINDFNGNLMYKIPLASGKDVGDLAYEVSLNYNGNVNYIINTADSTAQLWIHGQLHQYNITAPGWIVNFNGFAVQMLNFENRFFTRPTNGSPTNGRDVRLLASGYQYTDRFQYANNNSPDKITIMLGDGSTETLENNIDGNEIYTGWYRSTAKGSNVVAKVEFIPGDSASSIYSPYSKRRVMYYMRGDGLTYIFEEREVAYKDLVYSSAIAPKFRPLIFMLIAVKDRFGHKLSLEYGTLDGDNQCGRPVLTSCPGINMSFPVSFWGPHMGAKITTVDGDYVMYTDTYGLESEYRKRPNLIYLWNPSGEKMSFDYYAYERSASNLYKTTGSTFSIQFNSQSEPLYKLSKVQNFDGATRVYGYYGANHMNSSINFNPAIGENVSHSSSFEGQGRDIFFANMIDSAVTYNGSSPIRKVQYTYHYYAPRSNVYQKPVSPLDTFTTTKTVTALNGSINNGTQQSNTTVNYYKNYPTKRTFTTETTDYDGTIKLFEIHNQDQSGTFHKTFIEYDTGSVASDTVYSGTFYEKRKIENFDNITSEWKTDYTFSTTNDSILCLTSKTITDPFGKKDSVTFTNFLPDSYKYRVYSDGMFVWQTPSIAQGYDTTFFYLIQQPVFEFSKKNNTVLAKKENVYFNNLSMADSLHIDSGYPGELKTVKIFNPQTNALFSTIEYSYMNKDTTGMYLYNVVGFFRNRYEGAIKKIKDPQGNVTRYYYDLVSRSEDKTGQSTPCENISNSDEINCAPKLSYKQMNDDGTVNVWRTNWNDSRFPTRIDKFSDGTHFISNYQKYDRNGNITEIVDNNNYYSKILYDKYSRLAQATLPYDFNFVNPVDTVFMSDTTILDAEVIAGSNYFGSHDITSNKVMYGYDPYLYSYEANLRVDYSSPEDNPDAPLGEGQSFTPINHGAIVTINNTGFDHFYQIDSAFIEFSSSYVSANISGTPTTHFELMILPIKQFNSDTTATMGTGAVNLGNPSLSRTQTDINDSLTIARFDSNFRKVDVTSLLQSNISGNSLQIEGIEFLITDDGTIAGGQMDLDWNFYSGSESFYSLWGQKYLPKLKIYGRQKFIHNYNRLKFNNGTINYEYDDLHNKISVNSKIDGKDTTSRYKKTTNCFDGLRRIYHTKSFTDLTHSDSAKISYNYLDQKSVVTDGRNNVTKYRYDKYGSIDSTGNADNSYSKGKIEYQNGLSYGFGSVAGIVQKQTFTDESGHPIVKYTDVLGNLRREVRFIDDIEDPTPETTPGIINLITDYHYDDLYRVDSVKTPTGKKISYAYDAMGRQSKRVTPDAGRVEYRYDINNNLIYSQDENQRNISNANYTFRNYDGLKRLLYIGEADYSNGTPDFEAVDTTEVATIADNIGGITDLCLTINVYDTLSSAVAGTFSAPADYGTHNNIKGNLVATAYRTRKSDNWNYKYYRYDARGRVIRMWNVIDGLDTKITDYLYNSANQMQIFTYQSGSADEKRTKYAYDNAGRLSEVNVLMPQSYPDTVEYDNPSGDYFNFAKYTYNPNSQIDSLKLNRQTNIVSYSYNNRNWINYQRNNLNLFTYGVSYNGNGNISAIGTAGNYKGNFADTNLMTLNYTYDKANRLISTSGSTGYSHSLTNAYDKDGNITSLARSSTGNSSDNFTYNYISGTNKLARVSGYTDQYTYDHNGNMVRDEINKNYDAVYDYRNLLIYISSVRYEDAGDSKKATTYVTRYYYDEAGNRTRKMVFKSDEDEVDPPDWDNMTDVGKWILVANEFYVRDAAGKEIADYTSNGLSFWNIYGSDNVGRINADTTKQFYLNDHLGTTRAVVDASNTLYASYDFDAWGYKLREWNSSNNAKYKFTGKERDIETNYDYFGARYYDSRIGRWGATDPLFEKHINYTPYSYVLGNPLIFYDPDGKQIHHSNLFLGDDSWQSSNQYKSVYESNKSAIHRHHRTIQRMDAYKNPVEGVRDPGLDPIFVLAGGVVGLVKSGAVVSGEIVLEEVAVTTSESTSEGLSESLLGGVSESVAENISESVSEDVGGQVLPKFYNQLEKQLENDGPKSIFKSLGKFERRLAEHEAKIGSLEYTSSVEKEINTFKNSIETLKQFINDKGLTK